MPPASQSQRSRGVEPTGRCPRLTMLVLRVLRALGRFKIAIPTWFSTLCRICKHRLMEEAGMGGAGAPGGRTCTAPSAGSLPLPPPVGGCVGGRGRWLRIRTTPGQAAGQPSRRGKNRSEVVTQAHAPPGYRHQSTSWLQPSQQCTARQVVRRLGLALKHFVQAQIVEICPPKRAASIRTLWVSVCFFSALGLWQGLLCNESSALVLVIATDIR